MLSSVAGERIMERFEDIVAWQKARELTAEIYRCSQQQRLRKDFALRDQMVRAAISIMANIAEGFGRRSDKEFASFLNFSHGSVAETQSHLYVALDLKYISESNFSDLYRLFDEVSRMIMGLTNHLRQIK